MMCLNILSPKGYTSFKNQYHLYFSQGLYLVLVRSFSALCRASTILFLLNLFLGKSLILYALIVVFVLALPVESLLNEPSKSKKILPAEENLLTLLATKTWNYFASSLTEKNNFLPPDNYCEIEEKGFASRTSPTNIGMAIVSTCAACELKIIDRKTSENLISKIISTVEKLDYRN